MTFIPYLTFNGTCAEALQFYADVFGADDLQLMPFSQAPDDLGLGDLPGVMHGQLTVNGQTLMASDMMPGAAYSPQASVSISHAVADAETGQKIFDRLAEGGAIAMPYEPLFFAERFGLVKDRFGTHWMIHTNLQETP